MGVSPTRFAMAISGGLACLMLGLLAGVSAGSRQTGHVLSVETVTTTARAPLQAAVDRTVTVGGHVRTETLPAQQANAAARTVTQTVMRTVTDPVTVTETQTVAAPLPPGPGPKPGHGPKPGPGPKPGHGPASPATAPSPVTAPSPGTTTAGVMAARAVMAAETARAVTAGVTAPEQPLDLRRRGEPAPAGDRDPRAAPPRPRRGGSAGVAGLRPSRRPAAARMALAAAAAARGRAPGRTEGCPGAALVLRP